MSLDIFGIGNPLTDIIVHISEEGLSSLGLHKGTMHLIDQRRRSELIDFIASAEKTYDCGGSCPNTIITLASLGLRASLGGMVGEDDFGVIYKEKLRSHAVIDSLAVCEQPTGSSIILVTPDSERTMNTYLGANRYYGPENLNEQMVIDAKIFHFTGYMWDTESQKASIMKALSLAKEHGTLVSFDIADPFAVSRNREEFLEIIQNYADIVFANNEEARILFDNYDAHECAKSMGKLCSTAIVKNGKHGSFISHERTLHAVPVKGKEPLDTTGAGDIYAAGFLYAFSKGSPIPSCGATASYLAGEIISQVGAQFDEEKIREIRLIIDDIS